jgi:hypothetical protein
MDQAVTSRTHREQFLQKLGGVVLSSRCSHAPQSNYLVQQLQVVATDLLRWLTSRSVYLQSIRVHSDVSTEQFVSSACMLKHTRRLSFTDYNRVNSNMMFSLAPQCKQLEHLELGAPHWTTSDFCGESVLAISTVALKLRSLNLSSYQNMTNDVIIKIVSNCSSLTSLNLSNIAHISDSSMIAVATHCRQLNSLSVSCCFRLTDVAFGAISRSCLSINAVNYRYCYNMTHQSILVMASQSTQLISLNICQCHGIDDEAIEILVRSCAKLERLVIGNNNLTDKCLEWIARHCSCLRMLDIVHCVNCTAGPLKAILQQCRLLSTLHISPEEIIDAESLSALREDHPLVEIYLHS